MAENVNGSPNAANTKNQRDVTKVEVAKAKASTDARRGFAKSNAPHATEIPIAAQRTSRTGG